MSRTRLKLVFNLFNCVALYWNALNPQKTNSWCGHQREREYAAWKHKLSRVVVPLESHHHNIICHNGRNTSSLQECSRARISSSCAHADNQNVADNSCFPSYLHCLLSDAYILVFFVNFALLRADIINRHIYIYTRWNIGYILHNFYRVLCTKMFILFI